MKDTILLVGHGSREPAGNREVEEFTRRWRSRQPDWNVQVCFIEFADVLVPEGLDLAAANARRVIVLPLILNAAGHVKMEVPDHIEAARARHPNTEFLYAPHLGACDPILAILKRRLHEAMRALDMPDPRTTGVILLGRGSSDRMANGEVAKMARWLWEEGEHELVDIAFTGITHPRLERVVQRQARCGMTQIVVLPYYLFTGTLIERIKRQVEHLKVQYPRLRFARGEYFGFEDEIFAVLEQRVEEAEYGAGRMPCDGCKYREIAHDHGHGHRHCDDHHGHDHAQAAQAV
jgi:sirohydrochlorin cobaltochelatase